MYTNQKQTQDIKELRRIGGQWLKKQREHAKLSQRQLADILGVEYHTFISQIETGHGRIPPDRYEAWANAIGIPLLQFVRKIMRYYDPITHDLLFSDKNSNDSKPYAYCDDYQQMQEQVRELQRLLGQKTMELELAKERLLILARDAGDKLTRAGSISSPNQGTKKRPCSGNK